MPDEAERGPASHVPEQDADIHLQRLLAPQELDAPFYKIIIRTIKDTVHPPPVLPPLEITSKPVDPAELKGLNGLYAGNATRAGKRPSRWLPIFPILTLRLSETSPG